MSTKWVKIKEKTENHWLELKGDDGSCIYKSEKDKTPIYPYHAIAKWDGCVIFTDYANGYGYGHKHDEHCKAGSGCCEQSIHICDIDEMIEMLKGIKEQAKKHFGDEYYK